MKVSALVKPVFAFLALSTVFSVSAQPNFSQPLLRYGPPGSEKPGVLDNENRLRDLSSVVDDISGESLANGLLDALQNIDLNTLPLVEGTPRIGAPVSGTSKVIALGFNFVLHAQEAGAPVPTEPVIFLKATSAISGPYDSIIMPKGAEKVDWEVEFAVVIGKKAQYVNESEAKDHIAGYTICHDVSERSFQLERGGQYTKGKSADTFAPLGPWLVPTSAVANPLDLHMWLDVNGERKQDSQSNMIFGPAEVVSYISQVMTLLPGDVICFGTPSGVGLAQTPPQFLKPGDIVELGIEGLGQQRQTVKAWSN